MKAMNMALGFCSKRGWLGGRPCHGLADSPSPNNTKGAGRVPVMPGLSLP